MKLLSSVLLLLIGFGLLALVHFNRIPRISPRALPVAGIEKQHSTTHRLGLYDLIGSKEIGHCSATVVGPHAILTAQHCFKDSNKVKLDKEPERITVQSALLDGNDHVLYIVDRTFTTWSTIDQRNLVSNEAVHFWGAPGDSSDVYRGGYFQKVGTVRDLDPSFIFQCFVLPVFGGDSGSGIFDSAGNIVAVVSMADRSANEISLPLAFTPDQLKQAAQ